jgi:hypothetical protein
MRPARTKRSDDAIRRLIEQVIAEECETAPRGLALFVEAVELAGRPTERVRVWGTLHFLHAGSPFCCMEPACQLGVAGSRYERVCGRLQKALRITSALELDLDRIVPNIHDGVRFQPETS